MKKPAHLQEKEKFARKKERKLTGNALSIAETQFATNYEKSIDIVVFLFHYNQRHNSIKTILKTCSKNIHPPTQL